MTEPVPTNVALAQLDERYARLRLRHPRQLKTMEGSLRRYGQLAPLIACQRGDAIAVVDGFKRLASARALGLETLSVRVLPLNERAAVAAIYGLNRGGRGLVDLEEAMVVHELVRVQGLTQPQVGELLGRHKSWVSRRLSLVERLCTEVQDDVRVGLVPISVAREVARLPRGNQPEVAACVHKHGLSCREAALLVQLFEQTGDREQQQVLLQTPRELLEAHRGDRQRDSRDPRLGAAANKLRRQALWVGEGIARLERLLPQQPVSAWTTAERRILVDLLRQVGQAAGLLGEQLEGIVAAMGEADGPH